MRAVMRPMMLIRLVTLVAPVALVALPVEVLGQAADGAGMGASTSTSASASTSTTGTATGAGTGTSTETGTATGAGTGTGTGPGTEGTRAAEPAAIQHVPVNELESGVARIRFSIVAPDQAGTVIVRWTRAVTGAQVGESEARRTGAGYVAVLPADVVQPPGFRYWVVERRQGGEDQPVFASQGAPHTVRVFHDDARRGELARLAERGGKRSSLLGGAEYVDFGRRQLRSDGGEVPDRYYRLETGYGFAFLSTVEEIELRVVRVRGEAAVVGDGLFPGSVSRLDPGIDYGRAAVTLLLRDGIRLRGSILLGASQDGFEYGSGGALIFGNPHGIHVTLNGETLSTLGFTTGMRMGFLAAERLPMGAGVEVSNFPVGEDTGVRLIYDVGYELLPGSVLTLRAGFQGRTSVTGGPTLGMGFRYGF